MAVRNVSHEDGIDTRRQLWLRVQGCSVAESTALSDRGRSTTAQAAAAALRQGSPLLLSEVATERCHTASAALGPH